MGRSRDDVGQLFGFVRDRQRNRQWRNDHHLPASVAGWVLPAGGAPQGSDGLRPLGAVRGELLNLVQLAKVTADDRFILEAWYGLRQYPADLTGPNSLEDRIAARTPARPRRPLTARAVGLRRDEALHAVEAVLPARPAMTDARYGPLPPAWREPWCQPLLHWDLTRALDLARDLLAVSSAEPAESVANALHAELDELARRIANDDDTVPQRLARANAALSIALWDLAARTMSARRAASTATLPSSLTRSAVQEVVRATAPAEAASLLRGNHDDHSLLAAVRSAANQTLNPATAWPILELCLSEVHRGVVRRPPEVVCRVLYTVVQYARLQEDWRAVILARQMVTEHSTRAITLDACVDASIVAGSHLRFDEALLAIDMAEQILPRVVWAPPRVATIETAEWTFLLHLARTAVWRRAAEHAVTLGATDAYSVHALRLAQDCAREARAIPGFDGQRSDGGDADVGYLALPLLRTAELHGLAAQMAAVNAGRPDRLAASSLASARSALAAAQDLAAGERNLVNADFGVLYAKLRLRLAVVEGSENEAAAASVALQAQGWPIERSDLPMFLVLKEEYAGEPQVGLTAGMRRAARAALAAASTEDGSPEHIAFRVPAGHRRSQLRAAPAPS